MAKEIWLGPVLGNNRERLLARCAEYFARGQAERVLYIAASHPLLELVTEALLDGKIARGIWGEFPVYLFRGFVKRILSTAIVSEARGSGREADETGPLLARGLQTGALPARVPIDREDLPLRRSLISQIIKQLSAAGRLEAIKPLANRDGCVNTIASLIGEIQRAGKTAEEFQKVIEARQRQAQLTNANLTRERSHSQFDFDREVARIYSAYESALARFALTDEDADQLGALHLLRGDFGALDVALPWLKDIELLVLDGFFDFTPLQGEILRQLIPTIPNVFVNLNYDENNKEVFRPFDLTIDQLKSMGDFEIKMAPAVNPGPPALPEKLFNAAHAATGEQPEPVDFRYSLFECSDRETEIRAIAKEIKHLVFNEQYALSDIAVVLRERSAYAGHILRICADESLPCNLEQRIEATAIPSVRACAKLFDLFRPSVREHVTNPKTSDLAHLVKSGYFRISADDLAALLQIFESRFGSLETDPATTRDPGTATTRIESSRKRLGIGRWSPDVLENVFAYVGSELRVDAWLKRAERLITALPSPEAARAFIGGNEAANGDDAASITERELPEDQTEKNTSKAPAPVHPATIGWTIVVIERLRALIAAVPDAGSPEELRTALVLLLDQLQFSKQITSPFSRPTESADIPQLTLGVRGLESLRRAMTAAVRSFSFANEIVSQSGPAGVYSTAPVVGTIGPPAVGPIMDASLPAFIDEVERCLRSQLLSIGGGNRDGLRVLEATDVRGLRFRAVFIAGLTEGGFPLRISGDWLYPHEERERLRKLGVSLEDISTDTLLKEEHYFYQAACRATERLYLTRPIALDDGTETVPSYYIQELTRAITPATLDVKSIRADIDQKELRNSSSGAEVSTLLVRESTLLDGTPRDKPSAWLPPLTSEAASRGFLSESALRRVQIERERNGLWFGPYDGEISTDELRAMLARHFGPEYVYSASSLSTYGKCSFRFFASRVLKLEARNEAALDLPAIDAGKLLHEILRRFFEQHRDEYLPASDPAKLRTEMAEVAEKVFAEHERLVPALNERIWKIDCEIRKLILDQVLLYELRLQEKSRARGMRPKYFELAFGRASAASDRHSRADYLQLNRPDESETALVQGQIDRVDVNEQDRIAIAYDYKLSQGAKPADIEAARETQIPIYLAALEQLFVRGYELAGGGYYRLRPRSARLNQGLYRAAFADCTLLTGKNVHDDVQWQRIRKNVQRRIWEFIDGMRAGQFRVQPSLGKQTCKFCDYSAVCRYDTYRISRKRLSAS